jgi:hypothetical protein
MIALFFGRIVSYFYLPPLLGKFLIEDCLFRNWEGMFFAFLAFFFWTPEKNYKNMVVNKLVWANEDGG